MLERLDVFTAEELKSMQEIAYMNRKIIQLLAATNGLPVYMVSNPPVMSRDELKEPKPKHES